MATTTRSKKSTQVNGTNEGTTASTRTSAAVCERLVTDTAIAVDLVSQIKQAHWNVVGPNFIAIHELFDSQATLMRGHMDTLAERLRMVGGVPRATVRQAAGLSELPDLPDRELPSDEAVSLIADRYETFSSRIGDSLKRAADDDDPATEDLYTAILRDLDMQAWFLRSHLSG